LLDDRAQTGVQRPELPHQLLYNTLLLAPYHLQAGGQLPSNAVECFRTIGAAVLDKECEASEVGNDFGRRRLQRSHVRD
jgi:hypothetical protein